MEISGHLIDAEVPRLRDSLESFRAKHSSLGLPDKIESRNLQLSSASIDAFFNAFPVATELAGEVGISEKEILPHLSVDVFNKRIARIRLEKGGIRVSRRTDGYVSTRPMATEILLERAGHLLEQEFHNRYREELDRDGILEFIHGQSRILESTSLGRLYNLIMALREIRLIVIQTGLYVNRKYYEIIEKRTWKLLELKSRDFAGSADAGSFTSTEEKNTLPGESASKPGGAPGASSVGASRRASDSDQWHSYESTVTEGMDERGIDWVQSYRILGSFFTTRILLRKNLFGEIAKWIEVVQPMDDPDLGRILSDCETALQSLKERGGDPDSLEHLGDIVQRLREMVYRY